MATRAIKPKRDDDMLAGWESSPETAPSLEREDTPTAARILALIGLFLFALGIFAVVAPALEKSYLIPPGLGIVALTIGLPLLLFHAFTEKDTQYRFIYAFFAGALLLAGLVLRALAFAGKLQFAFLVAGVPALLLGLILAVGFLRQERDDQRRALFRNILGAIAALLIVTGVAGSLVQQEFLLGQGLLQMVLGLGFFAAFVAFQSDPDGFATLLASRILGGLGVLIVVVAAGRAFFDAGPGPSFFIPSGLLLMGVGLLYLVTALCVGSDWNPIVLFRRELAAFFYSPIAHLVLLGMILLAWFRFIFFVPTLQQASMPNVRGAAGGFPEPIVFFYMFDLFPVLAQMFIIPILTMRLFSEEKRSGTLEVLLTAPVKESSIVLSKFFAVLFFYLLAWVPFWLFLVALRVIAGVPFDFFPLLSFFLTMVASGAGFLAVGLFFSCITRNQIIAAVLTFVYVSFQWVLYARSAVFRLAEGSLWNEILQYASYLDLWNLSLSGVFAPRFLMFHLSVAFFFLFLTVKVLESRKWK